MLRSTQGFKSNRKVPLFLKQLKDIQSAPLYVKMVRIRFQFNKMNILKDNREEISWILLKN